MYQIVQSCIEVYIIPIMEKWIIKETVQHSFVSPQNTSQLLHCPRRCQRSSRRHFSRARLCLSDFGRRKDWTTRISEASSSPLVLSPGLTLLLSPSFLSPRATTSTRLGNLSDIKRNRFQARFRVIKDSIWTVEYLLRHICYILWLTLSHHCRTRLDWYC